jgi:hypothetical protein
VKRKVLLRKLREVARTKEVAMTLVEGGAHTKVCFDGQWVTTIARHREVPEQTARGALRAAERWGRS